jgi:hypothetical protein
MTEGGTEVTPRRFSGNSTRDVAYWEAVLAVEFWCVFQLATVALESAERRPRNDDASHLAQLIRIRHLFTCYFCHTANYGSERILVESGMDMKGQETGIYFRQPSRRS